MKRRLLLFSFLSFSIIAIHARSFVINGINYNITSIVTPNNVTVTSGVNYTGDVVIPSTVIHNDTVFSVTSINSNTFNGCSGLTSISIPNSVTSIGIGAFYGCITLNSINLDPTNPNFVYVDGILYNKSQSQIICCLTSKTGKIEIPQTVTNIRDGAFYGCTDIESVSIPNSVNSINSQAFYNCTGLTDVMIGDSSNIGFRSSVYIQSTAFTGCSGLTTLSIYLPVASYYYPFQNLSNLKTLVIGNSVTSIDYSTFSTLTGLSKVILGRADLSPVTMSVSIGAFSGSANLDTLNLNCNLQIPNYSSGALSPFSTISNLIIGEKVTSIGDYAFIGSKNLKSISVSNAVTSLGISAFAGSTNITDIIIGNSVAKLGTGVFTGCSSLLTINVNSANVSFSSLNGVLFSFDKLTLFQYPCARKGNYEIPALVKKIGVSAFSLCTGLQSINIPQSITSIQSSAFAECSGLTNVTIGHADSVSIAIVSISSDAFTNCSRIATLALNKTISFTSGDNSPFKNLAALTNLYVGNGVSTITDYAFSGCTGLTVVRLGQNNVLVKNEINVSGNAFYGCTNFSTLELNRSVNVTFYESSPFATITDLHIGNGTISLGDQSFYQCPNLSTVSYSASSLKIGNYAFEYCNKIQSFNFSGVSALGEGAFNGCTSLSSVIIPTSIKAIQPYTFYGCNALTAVSLNDSITRIGENAFSGCQGISSLTIPKCTKIIDASAFAECSGITTLTLGNSITGIGSSAFSGCVALLSINFPASLRTIGDNAFQDCKGLLSLYIPSTLTTVGSGAFTGCTGISTITIGENDNPGYMLILGTSPFSGCSGVTSLIINKNIEEDDSSSPFMSLSSLVNVTISNRVTHLNTFAFYNCSKITSLTIPNSVSSIGSAAFNGCSSLTSIKLPNKITSLGNSVFSGCSKLQSIRIPSSVSTIGNYAFYQCSSLSTIQLPKAVIAVGGDAFVGCTALNEFVSGPSTPAVLGFISFDQTLTTQCKLYVPTGSKSVYQNALQWKDFSNIIEKDIKDSISTPDSTNIHLDPITGLSKVVNITAGGLYQALTSTELANINKLTITGSINAVDFLIMRDSMPVLNIIDLSKVTIEAYTGTLGTGENTNITYPANTVPDNAFFTSNLPGGKISLISVILPTTVTAIGNNAFKNCSGLNSIPLPPSVTSIGDYAYLWCEGIKGNLAIPSSVTSIGIFAFSRCHGLTNITLPNSITTIERATFAECNSLIAIKISSSITAIKESAFYNCGELISVNIPSSVTSIEDNVFVYCGFATITLPPSITSISDYTFTECHALQSINIPAGLKSIGYAAFLRCYSLTSIYIYATSAPIVSDSYSFSYVNMNTCILYVPAGCLKTYQQANVWQDFVNIQEMKLSGINDLKILPLSIYPNPVKNGFSVNGLDESGILTLTTLNGSILLSKQVANSDYVSLNEVPGGIYIVRIVTNHALYQQKIIKK